MTIAALARAYREGELSPIEVVDGSLTCARRLWGRGWLISIDEPAIRRAAEESQARIRAARPRSALEGVPVTIKDQLDVAGAPTTLGTRFFAELKRTDAEAVARLRRAGAILFGKSNLCELALGPTGTNEHHGDALNPWDLGCDAGGSSSGSAALVAAGLVCLGLGSDLGGSLRIPAAHCGVAALKPTYGLVPTAGLSPVAPSLEHVGPIAADVEDLRIAVDVLGARALRGTGARLRVGLPEACWGLADLEVADATAAASRALARGGIDLGRSSLSPSLLSRAAELGSLIASAEAARSFDWALRTDRPLGPAVKLALLVGRAVSERELARARRLRTELAAGIDRALGQVDAILLPTTARGAPRVDHRLDEAAIRRAGLFTIPFNLGGLPALQLPWSRDRRGLPIGVQLVARHSDDARLLELGARLEACRDRPGPLGASTALALVRTANHARAPEVSP